MFLIGILAMTATATTAPILKDQHLSSFGLVESASVNSINDFTSSKFNEGKFISHEGQEEFVNVFICHLIFYVVFCVSLVIHILFDLGLWSFVKNKFVQFRGLVKRSVIEKKPAFA